MTSQQEIPVLYTEIFINNKFQKSTKKRTFETLNPATGKLIAKIEYGSEEDVDLAVRAAEKAFEFDSPWRTIDASERGRLLYKLADVIEKEKEYIAKLEALDTGKPYSMALLADIPGVVDNLRYYAGWADKITGQVIPLNGSFHTYTRHEPIGVCGLIIPWNFPLLLLAMKLGASLAAGNTVVIKPAEQSPLTSLYLGHLVQEVGFPPGVINIVPGDRITGAAVVDHPRVQKISFTGSSQVGLKIHKAVAQENNLKRVTLEMGGKSAVIVLGDVNVDEAVQKAQDAVFTNQGQVCCAFSRTFVHSSIYDEFVKKSAERAKTIKIGDPFDQETQHGAQIDETQMNRILNYISLGVKEGARLVAGGNRVGKTGYFVEPTVFADVQDNHTIAKEEIFGPVQQILKFDDIDEAIKRANQSEYGLAAGVFSNDVDKINYIVPRLKAGSVWVNCYLASGLQSPFGGYKNSGIGREGGYYGLLPYLEVKTVSMPVLKKVS
ncbi:aldehyde dehydrogenase, mitochondrial [Agrilus planipennis]|uniref:Aldehyde dehydrogenase, mitochondrial n=1 Tax=Agrilus planipennis TaxID=224129 RepID=A0A1W4X5T2_AGRPL|nr:aldehyde dehydrogenase, mitochondrial [Agrilus planipennis]